VARTALPPSDLASAVRSALKPIEPNLPLNEFRTLQQFVDKAVSLRRFVVVLLRGFAGFALLLASLGIYAVISYPVQRRTQEIGARIALGASARDPQSRIVSETLALAAIGTPASLILGRTMSRRDGNRSSRVQHHVGDPHRGVYDRRLSSPHRASRLDPMLTLRAD
jgi:ABC-type lipoprotein release transport system permease subunit